MADQETTQSEVIQETEAPTADAPPADTPPAAAPPAAAPPAAAPPAAAPAVAPPIPPQMTYEGDPRYAPPPAPRPPQVRVPFLAALCSFFPGLGNVYNGLYSRGITFFVICFGLIGIAGSTDVEARVVPIFGAIFVWLFNIFDAYRQATLINYGYVAGQLPAKPRVASWGSGGLMLGVAVFGIGFYFFLHNRFDVDLSIIFDNVDILVMAFGAFLIGRWVVEKKKAAEKLGDASDDLEI